MQVIRLVIDDVENGRGGLELPPLSIAPSNTEAHAPLHYILLFREYVRKMQDVLNHRDYIEKRFEGPNNWLWRKSVQGHSEFSIAQKHLSELIHSARKKLREIPGHTLIRDIEIEHSRQWGGCENLYRPNNWKDPLVTLTEARLWEMFMGWQTRRRSSSEHN